MKSKVLIIMLLTVFGANLSAQVKYMAKRHDFGLIAEDGGVVKHTFRFKNEGTQPIVILDFRTTCGCTTAEYTKSPILPGKEGAIEIAYDPMYRPGTFVKKVFVYTSGEKNPSMLTISGEVSPRKQTTKEAYPFAIGSQLRFETLYFNMRNIERDPVVQMSAKYINDSKQALDLELRSRHPQNFTYIYKKNLAAGEKAVLNLTHRFEQPMAKGNTMRDTVDVYINSIKQDKELYVKATVAY